MVLVAATAAALSACTGSSGPFGAANGAEVGLPDYVPTEELVLSTLRFQGEDEDGVLYFAVKANPAGRPQTSCLVVAEPVSENWARGCAETLPVTVGFSGRTITLHPTDGEVDPAQAVGRYVTVQGGQAG